MITRRDENAELADAWQNQIDARAARAETARAGSEVASQIITAQCDAGMDPEAIDRRHADLAADLVADAETADGRPYAKEYDDTAATLVTDLREDAAPPERSETAPAFQRGSGEPHPNPALAAKG